MARKRFLSAVYLIEDEFLARQLKGLRKVVKELEARRRILRRRERAALRKRSDNEATQAYQEFVQAAVHADGVEDA